jgi:uncharacterized membrane protein YfcA
MPESFGALFPSTTMLVVMLLATATAATMRAFSGFGNGLLLAPVFSLYLSPHDMIAVITIINLLGTLQMLPGVWRDIDWRYVFRMVPAALAGVPLGWLFLNAIDPDMVRRVVAILVILLASLLLAGWTYRGTRGKWQELTAGVCSGSLTAMAGMGGPPFILYMLSAPNYSPVAFRTFFVVFFVFSQVLVLGVILSTGAFSVDQLVYVGTLLPVHILATVLGSYLFVRALRGKAERIKRICLIILLAIGVVVLLA